MKKVRTEKSERVSEILYSNTWPVGCSEYTSATLAGSGIVMTRLLGVTVRVCVYQSSNQLKYLLTL